MFRTLPTARGLNHQHDDDFDELPPTAAWTHRDAREGFEVVFVRRTTRGWTLSGHTTAVEQGRPWAVRYDITVDRQWRSRSARVWTWNSEGASRTVLRHDGAGHWTVNGIAASELDGCIDVDLESSACTNTLPVHRRPRSREQFEAPAAYVRVANGEVQRLEQTYRRVSDLDGARRYQYYAPQFSFACEIEYDRHGLPLEYPGIARRVA